MNVTANKPPVIFLMGPTASGKTHLAIALSQHLPVDIISVDSAMIYKGMDIGTAKPSKEELATAPHALIDICDPVESYSVAEFCRDAKQSIDNSHSANRIPLLTGGSMMYFNALLQGLAEMPATDQLTRERIEKEAKTKGWPELHAELMQIDPDTALQIHPNHSQRIARALAVYRISGQTMTMLRKQQRYSKSDTKNQSFTTLESHYTVTQFALIPKDRLWLHERITQRYSKMLEYGFIDEVKTLYARNDLHPHLPSMRTVGYRQIWQWLAGEYDYDTMLDKSLAATRQLAKRQMTWLRGWKNLTLLNTDTKEEPSGTYFEKNINEVLKSL